MLASEVPLLLEVHGEELGTLGDEVDERVDDVVDLLRGRRGRSLDRADPLVCQVQRLREDLEEQLLLVLHVVVERRLRDGELLRDLLDRGADEAAVAHEQGGSVEDLLTTIRSRGGRRRRTAAPAQCAAIGSLRRDTPPRTSPSMRPTTRPSTSATCDESGSRRM